MTTPVPAASRLRKALFLDRDGVVNEDSHYLHKPEHIRFLPGVFNLCREALKKGYLLIVVTNQAGVAKGYFSERDVRTLHKWMAERFKQEGVDIAAFYYCPYHEKATVAKYRRKSSFRKPGPGMILKAAKEHGIDISRSLVVGDKNSDRIPLEGLRSVIVKSQYVPDGWDVETLEEVEGLL